MKVSEPTHPNDHFERNLLLLEKVGKYGLWLGMVIPITILLFWLCLHFQALSDQELQNFSTKLILVFVFLHIFVAFLYFGWITSSCIIFWWQYRKMNTELKMLKEFGSIDDFYDLIDLKFQEFDRLRNEFQKTMNDKLDDINQLINQKNKKMIYRMNLVDEFINSMCMSLDANFKKVKYHYNRVLDFLVESLSDKKAELLTLLASLLQLSYQNVDYGTVRIGKITLPIERLIPYKFSQIELSNALGILISALFPFLIFRVSVSFKPGQSRCIKIFWILMLDFCIMIFAIIFDNFNAPTVLSIISSIFIIYKCLKKEKPIPKKIANLISFNN